VVVAITGDDALRLASLCAAQTPAVATAAAASLAAAGRRRGDARLQRQPQREAVTATPVDDTSAKGAEGGEEGGKSGVAPS